jgi:hypothetical protein
MTLRFLPTYRDSVKYQFYLDTTGLPLRSLAYENSRFCFEEDTKPAHEHHLQVFRRFAILVRCRLSGLLKGNET